MNKFLFSFLVNGSLEGLKIGDSKTSVLKKVPELFFERKVKEFDIFSFENLEVLFYKNNVVSITVSLWDRPVRLPKSVYSGKFIKGFPKTENLLREFLKNERIQYKDAYNIARFKSGLITDSGVIVTVDENQNIRSFVKAEIF